MSWSVGLRRSPSTATTERPGIASAQATWDATDDFPSRASPEVTAMTGFDSENMRRRELRSCWNASRARWSPVDSKISAGPAPGVDQHGHFAQDVSPTRSRISSAVANRRRSAAAARAANTAAMRPKATAATRIVLRGFVGEVGSGAGPSSDRTRVVLASRFVTLRTAVAAALA